MINFDLLCDEQRVAVEHEGDIVIVGGAGSGKTLVAQLRICYQMERQPNKGFLYYAFSRKLVDESKKRFGKMLPPDQARRLTLCTQHALAARIIREYGDRLGFRTSRHRNEPQVIQEEALAELMLKAREEAVELLNNAGKTEDAKLLAASDITVVRGFIQAEKRTGRMPDVSMAEASEPLQKAFAAAYTQLQALLLAHNRIDIDDMLLLCAHLLRTFPDIAAFYRSLFSGGITMDEAQDYTPLQYEINELLAGKQVPVTLVGDPEQTVFGFRGVLGQAVFDRFQVQRPRAKQIFLRRNYRSDEVIVAFENLYAPLHCRQEATRKGGSPITFKFCADEADEVRWVTAEVKKALLCEAVTPDQIAVLAQTRDQLAAFAVAFLRADIPCLRVGKCTFWDDPDIRFFVACLALSQDPEDAFAFKRIAGSPFKGLAADVRAKLRGEDAELRREHLDDAEHIALLEANAQATVKQLKNFLAALDYIKDVAPAKFVEFLMVEAGYKEHVRLASTSDKERDERLSALRELHRLAQEFESVSEFLDDIVLMSGEDPFSNTGRQKVQLMTFHDAKGSEFEAVFLTGLENDLVPHRMAQATAAIEEELKLFRMAIKRAQRFLIVTACRERGGEPKETSLFLRSVDIPKAIRCSVTHWTVPKPIDQPGRA